MNTTNQTEKSFYEVVQLAVEAYNAGDKNLMMICYRLGKEYNWNNTALQRAAHKIIFA